MTGPSMPGEPQPSFARRWANGARASVVIVATVAVALVFGSGGTPGALNGSMLSGAARATPAPVAVSGPGAGPAVTPPVTGPLGNGGSSGTSTGGPGRPDAPPTVVARTVTVGNGWSGFRGDRGTYRWTTLVVPAAALAVRWDASAAEASCEVRWTLDPARGAAVSRTLSVEARGQVRGSRSVQGVALARSALTVHSTCPDWRLALRAAPGGQGQGKGQGSGARECRGNEHSRCHRDGNGKPGKGGRSGHGDNGDNGSDTPHDANRRSDAR